MGQSHDCWLEMVTKYGINSLNIQTTLTTNPVLLVIQYLSISVSLTLSFTVALQLISHS